MGYWSAPVELAVAASTSLQMTIWPATRLRAQLLVPPATKTPSELRIRLIGATPAAAPPTAGGTRSQPVAAEVLCQTGEKGKVDCNAPAGRWNLRAEAEGLAPRYIWNVSFEPGQVAALGTLRLKKGASLLGRVVAEAGSVDHQHVELALRPVIFQGPGAPHQLGVQLPQLVHTTHLNAAGFFHFEAVPSGNYTLEALQPGFQPARLSPVALRSGDMIEMDEALVLRPLLGFAITLDPDRDPGGKPWKLLLTSVKDGAFEDTVGSGGASGRWNSPPLPAGAYAVQVLDANGNSFHFEEAILVQSRQKLEIKLALVRIFGTVRFRGEPLSSRLIFGGHRGHGGTKIEVSSNTEGDFSLVLPRPGKWTVDVEAEDPQISVLGREFDLVRRRDGRPTRVELEVPDTVARGTVTDELGRPVSGAWVHLTRFEPAYGMVTRRTDPAGTFAIHGQLPGRCFIEARTAAGETSEALNFDLTEGAATTADLVVAKKKALRGRVSSATGPLAGAQVFAYAFPAFGPPTLPAWDQAATNLDGAFQLMLPPKTAQVQLVVLSPGNPLAVWRAHLDDRAITLDLQVASSQGTLRLPRVDSNRVSPLFPLLLVNGEPLPGHLLAAWAQSGMGALPSGDIETIPAMPSGVYRYCDLEPQEALLVQWGVAAPSESSCNAGYLSPGGELTLESPDTD
jgi:Carboxypeptidase regulatory-like domain